MVRLVISLLCELLMLVLIARMILSWVVVAAPRWQPRGLALVAANLIYRVTDPPLRLLGRWFKPVRLGALALDTSFLALFVILLIVQRLNAALMPI